MGTVKKKMTESTALKGLKKANKDKDLSPIEKKFRVTSMMLAAMKTPVKTVTIIQYVPVPGVVPAGKRKAALALDATPYDYVNSVYGGTASFQGYPYLANLAQLPEYRSISDTIATELTRKFVKITSKGDSDKTEKIKKIQDCFDRLDVRGKFRVAALYDSLYGRGQIYVEFKGKGEALASEDENELAAPLFLSNKKIAKGSLTGLRTIEPVWTYPSAYNATNPLARDYYQPGAWYVMNKTVHTSRLLTFVSRPVPDLLKASYNFGGLSMSQLAEPYVNNWLRTRDSVSDMIHSYSVAGLSTDLSTLLGDGESATDLANRAALFTQTRDNRGLMILNKDSEEFFQFNTPLSGLSDLQEQAQGQLCFVSHLPPIKLFGVSPGGLSGSGEDIMVAFRDWIESQREILFTDNLNQIMGFIQLSELGELDPDIVWEFEPLEEMSDADLAEINDKKSKTDVALIGAGVLAPEEVRTRLAADEHSGYNGLDVEDVPEIEEEPPSDKPKEKPAQDGFLESEHPRDDSGKFSVSGGGVRAAIEQYKKARPADKYQWEKDYETALENITSALAEQGHHPDIGDMTDLMKKATEGHMEAHDEDGDLTDEGFKLVDDYIQPLKEKAAREAAGELKREDAPVNDPAHASEILRTILEKYGYSVAAGSSGKSSSKYLEISKGGKKDKIRISDHPLPVEYGESGLELKLYNESDEVRPDGRIKSDKISEEEATKRIESFVSSMGISVAMDSSPFTYKQFLAGFKAEQEHLDSVDGDEETIIKIVIDHLNEDPEYYSKMASDAEIALDSITIAEDQFDYVGYANDAAHWITTEEGSHILIDGNGEVIGGAGGKLNGAKFERVQSKSKNVEHGPVEKPQTPQSEHADKKPKFPEFYQEIRDKHDKPYWNGKFYGDDKKGYRIYVSEKEYKIKPEQKKELEENRKDFLKWKESAPPEDKSGHQYLNVPYDDRDKAKSAGAKWDAEKKKWYVPGGVNIPDSLLSYKGGKGPYLAGPKVTESAKNVGEMTDSEFGSHMKELYRKRREYNNGMNEGGEGYNPYDDQIDKAERQRDKQTAKKSNSAKIYLSSRGWGDFSGIEWEGDITQKEDDILKEMKELLSSGHDVDTPNQTDEELLAKIRKEKEKNK